jgi:hypothetical protein
MVDAQTGKTWILTKITTDYREKRVDGKDAESTTLAWQPILFCPLNATGRHSKLTKQKKGRIA